MKLVLFVLGFVISTLLITSSSLAQENSQDWNAPIALFEGEGWTQYNDLVASSDGKVHVFWQSDPSKITEGTAGIPGADNLWYTRIDLDTPMKPVNILTAPPNGGLEQSIRAFEDRFNRLHLFLWTLPNCLQHSYAPTLNADKPLEWIAHVNCVGETSSRFGGAVDSNGLLHLAYGTRDGRLIYQRYDPATNKWVFETTVKYGKPGLVMGDVRIAVDTNDRLHLVWSEAEAPTFYPPSGIRYARSIDGGYTWSEFTDIAGLGHTEPEIITIGTDQIHVAWNGSAVINNRYHRFSNDGGTTWSNIYTFEIAGGILGPPALAVDSSDTLHAAFSSDIGLYYASWNETKGWSPLQQLINGVQTGDPAMIVAGGNMLHMIYREGTRRIWYINRTLNTPKVTPQPTFTRQDIIAAPVSLTSNTQTVVPAANARQKQENNSTRHNVAQQETTPPIFFHNSSSTEALIFALATTLLLIGAVAAFQLKKRS